MFRYFRVYENIYIYPDHFVFNYPFKPVWNKEWEWTLTFSEIFNLIKQEVNYALKMWLYKKLFEYNFVEYARYTKHEYKEFNTEDLERYLFSILEDMNMIEELYFYKKMIIFGSDVAGVFRANHSYNTLLKMQAAIGYKHKTVYAIFDIPAYFFPHISGIHVLPDMTGTWSERVHEEETVFRRMR